MARPILHVGGLIEYNHATAILCRAHVLARAVVFCVAAMVLLEIRDDGHGVSPFRAANLVFGVFDWGRSPSQRGFRPNDGPDWLSPEAMAEFADFYLPDLDDDERRDGSVSPAFADLRAMPPALFTVGTLDHMFDDTILTAARWSAAGNTTELAVYPDCGHGFHWFTDTELSRRAVTRIHDFLVRYASGNDPSTT